MMNRMLAGTPGMTPWVKKVLILLGSIWLMTLLTVRWFEWEWMETGFRNLLLHPGDDGHSFLYDLHLWQGLTYMFLHDLSSPFHLFFNGLMLFFLAPLFESRWGARGLTQFLVFCGLGAALFTALAGSLIPSYFGAPVLGASGAILGLISAFAVIYPRQPIYLWFLFRVEGRYLIPLTLGIDTLLFLTQPGSFAFATHVGGLFTGWLLVTGNWRISKIRNRLEKPGKGNRRPHLRVVDPDEQTWVN